MGQKRANLEWQLSRAAGNLATCEKELETAGIGTDARPKNPKWRNLNARCRQLRNRLNAVGVIEKRDEEVRQRAEAASAEG